MRPEHRPTRFLVNGLIAVGVVLGGVGYGAAATPTVFKLTRPRTLVTVPGPIVGFAQDGTNIVWARGGVACGGIIQLKSLSTGAARFLDRRGGPMCEELEEGGFVDSMTLAGTRALWATAKETLGNVYFRLFTAVPGGGGERRLGSLALDHDDELLAPVPMAGDAGTLLFARRSSGYGSFERSGVYRVGQRARSVAGTEGALDIAAEGSRFVLARRISGGCACNFSPLWSPDGKHIAFVSYRAEGSRPQVFVMNADGSDLHKLTDGESFEWAPDGSALAAYNKGNLIVARPDGGVRTFHRGGLDDIEWSPDAQQLAFADSGRRIHVISAAGGSSRQLGVRGGGIVWSPDSQNLAYARFVGEPSRGSGHVFVIPASGGRERDLGSGSGWPRWSPDSRRLAYTRWVDGPGMTTHVVVASLSGTPAVDLGVSAFHSWSPDSTAVAFTRQDGIYLAAADGSAVRRIAATGCGNCLAETEWSRDGRWIAFADGDLWVVRPDGGALRRLARGVKHFVWSPTSRALSYVPPVAASAGGSMMIVDIESGAARRIPAGLWVSWSPDGQGLVYVLEPAGRPSGTREIAVTDMSGTSTVLTHTEAAPARIVVETRARTGNRLSSFDASLNLIGLAFSGSRVALVLDKAGFRPEPVRGARTGIEIRTTAGRLLRRVVVPRPMWGELTMSGRWVAFVTWPTGSGGDEMRAIRLLDVLSGRTTILARAPIVVGLSIDGNRVAWAETGPTTSRVRAVTLRHG
jgi:Tol biopolymer transport system component